MPDQYQSHPYSNPIINGNSVDVKINSCDSEVKVDIVVSEFQSIRLWGQVKTCDGKPVGNALLKLIKELHGASGCEYVGIAHTVSDCKGFYQFDICQSEAGSCFKIIVSKATIGSERVVSPQESNCNPCQNAYSPCVHCGFGQSNPVPCNCQQCAPTPCVNGCEQTYSTCPPHVEPCGCECKLPKQACEQFCTVNTCTCRSQNCC